MKLGLALTALLILGVVAGFYAYSKSEFTQCFARFESPEAAEQAASVARAAGFDADVEAAGPESRLPSSGGGRQISVDFSDGETGDHAEAFRRTFHAVVDEYGGSLSHRGNGCLERSPVR